MPVVAAEVPVAHRVFVRNVASTGRHGSAQEGTLSDPITRLVYQVYPMHWRASHADPPDIEDYNRTVTDLLMDVPDPSLYKKRDQVAVNGVSFEVQGLPDMADWSNGTQLFSEYDDLFGGTVHLRRVT